DGAAESQPDRRVDPQGRPDGPAAAGGPRGHLCRLLARRLPRGVPHRFRDPGGGSDRGFRARSLPHAPPSVTDESGPPKAGPPAPSASRSPLPWHPIGFAAAYVLNAYVAASISPYAMFRG